MNVGIYTPQYPNVTSEGGVGTYSRNLGYALSARGHRVHLLTPGSPLRVCSDGPLTIQVSPADYFPIIERFLPGSGSCYRVSSAMRRLVAEQRIDLVEFANWEGLGAWFQWGRSIPMVVRLHTSSREAHTIDGNSIRGAVRWDVRRERWQARMADALVTHSMAHQKEMVRELGIEPDRIAVIPHGIEVYPEFQRPESSGTQLNVVFLGRLETRKGTLDLLKAIPQVLAALPQVKFTLIGRDREHCPGKRSHAQYIRDEFPPNVQTQIDLAGQLPDGEVNRRLQAADLFVAPSLYESFGLVFLEAMRWGTCVIGTEVGGIPEIIEQEKSGVMVKPQSSVELADAMIVLLKNPARRHALGEAGRKRVESLFTLERMAQQVERLYKTVITDWKLKSRRGSAQNLTRFQEPPAGSFQERYAND